MPSTKRTSTDVPGASGVPRVIAPTDSEPLKPDPFGWLGGCSSVVPRTVRDRTRSTMSLDVSGRRSATPDIDGNVVMSMMRNRNRVMFAARGVRERPPDVQRAERRVLCRHAWRDYRVRRRAEGAARAHVLGGALKGLVRVELRCASRPDAIARRRVTLRFSGPGAPSRWPAPALVPLVSTKMKSAALLLVS